MTPARYSRDELARLEGSLRELAANMSDENRYRPDLEQTADFLAETVGVLDRQKAVRDKRKASAIIAQRKRRTRRG